MIFQRLKFWGLLILFFGLAVTMIGCDTGGGIETSYYDLTIEVDGEGTTEPGPDTHEYKDGEIVKVKAIPADNWNFNQWTGDVDSTDKEISVYMDGNKSVTAHFEQKLAYFEVDITDYPEEVSGESSDIEVEYEVANTGDIEETQDIEFFVNNELEDSEEITLAAGDVHDSEFIYTTISDDVGEELEIKIASNDDTAEITVNVMEPAVFNVAIDENKSDNEVLQGEELTIVAEITNTGDFEDTQDITLDFGEEAVDNKEVTVAGNDSEDVSLTYNVPEEIMAETKEVTVRSEDTQDSYQVEILESSNYILSVDEATDDEILQGETFTTVIEVENTGDVEGEVQTIEFYWNQDNDAGVADRTEDILLEANESDSITFTYEVEKDATPGETNYYVTGEDDSVTDQVTVLEVGKLMVENFSTPQEAEQEEEIEVSADIENNGDIELTQDIKFKVDEGVVETNKDFTVAADDSEHVSFQYTIPAEQEEDIKVEIATEDDDEFANVTVELSSIRSVDNAKELYDALENQDDYDEIKFTDDIVWDKEDDVELTSADLFFNLNGHSFKLDNDKEFNVLGDNISVKDGKIELQGNGEVLIEGNSIYVESVDFELDGEEINIEDDVKFDDVEVHDGDIDLEAKLTIGSGNLYLGGTLELDDSSAVIEGNGNDIEGSEEVSTSSDGAEMRNVNLTDNVNLKVYDDLTVDNVTLNETNDRSEINGGTLTIGSGGLTVNDKLRTSFDVQTQNDDLLIDGSNNNIDGSGKIILPGRSSTTIDEVKNVTLDVEVEISGDIFLSGQVTTNEQVQLTSSCSISFSSSSDEWIVNNEVDLEGGTLELDSDGIISGNSGSKDFVSSDGPADVSIEDDLTFTSVGWSSDVTVDVDDITLEFLGEINNPTDNNGIHLAKNSVLQNIGKLENELDLDVSDNSADNAFDANLTNFKQVFDDSDVNGFTEADPSDSNTQFEMEISGDIDEDEIETITVTTTEDSLADTATFTIEADDGSAWDDGSKTLTLTITSKANSSLNTDVEFTVDANDGSVDITKPN